MYRSVKRTIAMITAIFMAISLLPVNSLAHETKDSRNLNSEVESSDADLSLSQDNAVISTAIVDELLSEGESTLDYTDNRDADNRAENRGEVTNIMEDGSSDNALQVALEFADADEGVDEYADLQVVPPREGYCGGSENKNALSWGLNDDGTLVIRGTGAMADYGSYGDESPWYRIRTEVKSVVIEEGVTTVGVHAFSHCSQLTSVRLPQTLNKIGYSAFSYCSSLSNIMIPDGLSTLEGNTFYHCTELEHLEIPKNVSEIESYVFDGCTSLTSIDVDDANTTYKSINGILFTKSGEELICYPAGKQGDSYTIPDEVKTIGSISDNKNLKDIHIGNGVLSANTSSFNGCTSLSEVYYSGTRSEWKQITLGSYISKTISEIFPSDIVIRCIDGDITVIDGIASEDGVINSGFCGTGESGDNIQWTLTTDGTLTFNGDGRMANYSDYGSSSNSQPWSKNRSAIKNVIIQSGITNIGRYAFYECENLEDIIIPDSLEDITDRAFYNCSKLRRVSIPSSVTSIGTNSFMMCESLEAFNVEAGNSCYRSIDGVLFNKDATTLIAYPMGSNRTSYEIPQGVSSIYENAFWGDGNLNHISIPNSMTIIDDEAFWACYSLSSVTVPEGVTSIGSYAFASTALTDISIPNGVTSIGHDAFENCSSLKNISLPDTVTSIGDDAFENCSNLESIVLPDDLINISHGMFRGCSHLSNVTLPHNLKGIGDSAFSYCENLTQIAIPESVENIGRGAFSGCAELTTITLPDGLTEVGGSIFNGCIKLIEVTIPVNITSIADYAFNNCRSLRDIHYTGTRAQWNAVTIGERNTSVYATVVHCSDGGIDYSDALSDDNSSIIANGTCGAEDNGTNLTWSLTENGTFTISGTGAMQDYGYDPETDTEIEVPWKDYDSKIKFVVFESGVTHIGNCLFDGDHGEYDNLIRVVFPNSVTSIGQYVFLYCHNLTSVEIPSSAMSIGDGAFTGCPNLSSVTISDGVQNIGNWAFQVCGLKNVRIPSSVTSIGDGPFISCSQLEEIQVDAQNSNYASVDGVLFNKDRSLLIQYPAGKKDSSYNIPVGVTEIGYNAFEDCSHLINVSFPAGLERIDEGAFYLCESLGDITLPQGLISIGSAAFRDCKRMVNVTIPNSVMMIDSGAFTFCDDFKHVYYMGTKEQWEKISIDSYNPFDDTDEDGTSTIIIHYNGESSYEVSIDGIIRRDDEISITVDCSDSTATLFCGVYDNRGKMIAVRSVQITSTSDYSFRFSGHQFDYAKAFIIDSNFRPLCESKQS